MYAIFCLHVCLCTHAYLVPRGQKKTSDPLDLELERMVGHHVVAGNGTSISGRAASVGTR